MEKAPLEILPISLEKLPELSMLVATALENHPPLSLERTP